MVNRIRVAGLDLDHFWHCFGTERHWAELPLALQMLQTSKTNVLPVNNHRLDATGNPVALEHGFARATYAEVGRRVTLDAYVTMLNINLRTSKAAAVETAKIALDMGRVCASSLPTGLEPPSGEARAAAPLIIA